VLRNRDRSFRRVLKVESGKVTYEARGKTATGGSCGERTIVGDGKFARDVVREVTCDYDPIIWIGHRHNQTEIRPAITHDFDTVADHVGEALLAIRSGRHVRILSKER
jgi:hypothetical protein